jgi:Domain of unknown function (DUF6249)
MNLIFLVPVAAIISVFSFAAVAVWSYARRREREAYYRSETIKKITETRGGESAMEFLREEERNAARRLREGLKLGGVITVAVGIGLMIFLGGIGRHSPEPIYLVGVIPLLIGSALLAYTRFLAPKQ